MTAVNAHVTTEAGVDDAAITRVGCALARYGLVVVIGWVGLLDFTSYEAHGIQPSVANGPVLSWVYERRSASS